MKFCLILLAFLAQFLILSQTAAGGEKAKAQLEELIALVDRRDFQGDKLRIDLLAFCQAHVGTPLYVQALEALTRVPSPLDRLDPEAIDAEDRKIVAIPELVGYIRPHNRAVAHVTFSFDGKLLISSGWDNTVHVHKLGGNEPRSWAKLDASSSGVAISPDAQRLATGCSDTRLIVWDLSGDAPRQRARLGGHKNRPFSIAFSPNGKMLASACYDPILRIFKMEEAEPEAWAVLANESTPSLGISSLAFSHDGKYLVAGSHLGKETLRVWDAAGSFLEEKSLPAATARLVACSPAGPHFAFNGHDAVIHIWEIKAPDRFEKLRTVSATKGVKALVFSPDGKSLASSTQDGRLSLWDLAAGKLRHEWRLAREGRAFGFCATALAFSSDGHHLAVGNSDGTLSLLRIASLTSGGPK